MKTLCRIKMTGLAFTALGILILAACAGAPNTAGAGHEAALPQPGQGASSSSGGQPPPPSGGSWQDNGSGSQGPCPPSGDGYGPNTYTVSEIYENILRLHGTVVPVAGTFMGWSGCRDNTRMRTRSDWVLSDGRRCVFVTGGPPFHLDPKNKEDRGKNIQIRALVLKESNQVLLRNMGEN